MKYLEIFEKFYNPPQEIKDKLENIVQDLLIKYKGGRLFFDALDDSIKSITNQDMILSLVKGNSNEWIISSGEFGDMIYNLWESGKFKCKGIVIFNGKMNAKKTDVRNWYPSNFDLDNKEFIYIDDSLFSGNTSKKIDNYLKENHSSKIKSISVIYDGSKEKNKMIKSFFRYYK